MTQPPAPSRGPSGAPAQAASCGVAPGRDPNAVLDLSGPEPTRGFFTRWLGLDLRSLALFRVGLAVIVLGDLLQRAASLRAHYSDEGVLPRSFLFQVYGPDAGWSLHNLSGDPRFVAVLFLAAAAAAGMMLVGCRTRLATFLVWLLTASVINRNPLLGQSGDTLLRMLLFWGVFLPLGARWSVDSACNALPRVRANLVLSAATVALLVQLCVLYWFSLAHKWGPTWLEGHAVYYALQCDMFLAPAGLWLRQFTGLFKPMTYLALAAELLAPAILIFPWRNGAARLVAVAGMAVVHFLFGFFLTVGIFSPVAIVMWLAFLPSCFWDALFSRLDTPARRGLRLYIDGQCAFCLRGTKLLRTFCLLPGTPILAAQDDPEIDALMRAENSWVVVDHEGGRHFRADAAACLLSASPLLFPLAPALRARPLARAADALYRLVARNRQKMAGPTAALAARPLDVRLGPAGSAVVVAAVALSLISNICSLDPLGVVARPPGSRVGALLAWSRRASEAVKFPTDLLQLSQFWAMYAPSPLRRDGWFVAEAFAGGKQTHDLLRGGAPVSWEKPALVSATFPDQRWQKLMENLAKPDYKLARRTFCRYLARAYNDPRRLEGPVTVIKFYMVVEETLPDGIAPPERRLLEVHLVSDIPNAIERRANPEPDGQADRE